MPVYVSNAQIARPRREKLFTDGCCIPMDRNAKVRIQVYARAWNERHRQPRQHRGPLTRAILEVLKALLWGFHNNRDGRCFPSYVAIAEQAQCHRDTVHRAIHALEAAGILTWVNRLIRVRVQDRDLFGRTGWRWRVFRTSNAYRFRDPGESPSRPAPSKSENPAGTPNQESSDTSPARKHPPIDPDSPLEKALEKLQRAINGPGDRKPLCGGTEKSPERQEN